jgi:hypothetical protein
MNEFIERLKTDKNLQLILGGLLVLIFIFFLILRPVLFSKKNKTKGNLPCYQATLKIWAPFDRTEFFNLLKDASVYCLNFEIEEKSIEKIKKELPLSLIEKNQPDIIYIDNDTFKKYEQIFAYSKPIIVDSLIAYYNKSVLDFLGIEKPRTTDELQKFIQKVKEYNPNFYVIGLGTDKVKNRKEIILSLYTLFENYKDKKNFVSNLKEAMLNYAKFADPQSDFYSYSLAAGEDIFNFAYEKLAIFIGFYEDKKELIKLNPNLEFSIGQFPLNSFPPKIKIYSKIYYLASLKNKKAKTSKFFIDWFASRQLLKFADRFGLVPYGNFPDLAEDKKIVADSFEKFGETFDFFNKEILFEKIDLLIKSVYNMKLLEQILNEISYSI